MGGGQRLKLRYQAIPGARYTFNPVYAGGGESAFSVPRTGAPTGGANLSDIFWQALFGAPAWWEDLLPGQADHSRREHPR